jgi:hypothetical protein
LHVNVAALDLLWARKRILAGDYLAGTRFRFLAQHRARPAHRADYEAAMRVLERCGQAVRTMIEIVCVDGDTPRTERGFDHAATGLHELNRHFRESAPKTMAWPRATGLALAEGIADRTAPISVRA